MNKSLANYLNRPATASSRNSWSGCASPASRRCLSTRQTFGVPANGRRRPWPAGLEHVQLIQSDIHPLVYGDWLHAGPGSHRAHLRPFRCTTGGSA